MRPRAAVLAVITTLLVVGFASAQTLPTAKPEQVGLSADRLERVSQTIKAQMSEGRFPGAVVLIARKGKIGYFEAFGQRDPAAGVPMSNDQDPALVQRVMAVMAE